MLAVSHHTPDTYSPTGDHHTYAQIPARMSSSTPQCQPEASDEVKDEQLLLSPYQAEICAAARPTRRSSVDAPRRDADSWSSTRKSDC